MHNKKVEHHIRKALEELKSGSRSSSPVREERKEKKEKTPEPKKKGPCRDKKTGEYKKCVKGPCRNKKTGEYKKCSKGDIQ